MKLDYKVDDSWSLGHRRPRRMRRHVLAMSVCAVVTFIGYTKYSSEQQPQDESSWSIPGGVMAAYPVLDTPQRIKKPTPGNAAPADTPPTDSAAAVDTTPGNDETFRIAALGDNALDDRASDNNADTLATDAEYEILKETDAQTATNDLDTDWQKVAVKNGDSMARIFKRLGLSPRQLHEIMQLGDVTQALKSLRPGQELLFDLDEKDERTMLRALQYAPDSEHQLIVERTDNGYQAELADADLTTRVRAAAATIDSSLFLAGQAAGLSDNLIMQLVKIYGWDIDFVMDIRKGDQFSVIFKETYRDGTKIKDGPIIAAEFQNRGRTLRAVRYTTPDGRTDYYADDGRSMRKAFLRTPMDVYRISSHFDPDRRHPVMNTIRAHKGTDYAAPTGTPIKASGDGRISHLGRKGGYGNTIIIQHGGRYSTLYAHMSRFARGLRQGSRVEQGQTIGHVGSTGLATGPHLHYEFRINGVHKNPVKVELPKAESIPEKLQADFKQSTRPLLAELDKLERYDGRLEVADHQVDDKVLLALGESATADGDSGTR
ncbi:murein DD-endopeptidase MepM/ murein hydrolase activator NlpD [Methylohalomonas lacus]|uniref:Murein DD-endopeptidase MepM/ murein hydrolase activator NlpD n=1 Tax=Methylohalomonas lacus TaxID=398773 RepID=A0AAE3L489_9GAMM|nr:peptidoglycan DD-metalloendopeptidase family protein [Methylohalomonas lacus]MCS3903473.1 murein DD-endopeptidase MepM/ murein hydrolase activator NlpD [Methylohalomonas lacus]